MSKVGVKRIDRIGVRFGRLVIVRYTNLNQRNVKKKAECICDCGNKLEVDESSLVSGGTRSCGCLKTEVNKAKGDGRTKTKLYRVYYAMKSRCYSKKDKGFENYGGRGIKVCREWLKGFDFFNEWALRNGWVDGLELDRIDNDKGYSPANCRFISHKHNTNNRRKTIRIEYLGETKTIGEWAKVFGISERLLRSRYSEQKMPFEKAIKKNALHKERKRIE